MIGTCSQCSASFRDLDDVVPSCLGLVCRTCHAPMQAAENARLDAIAAAAKCSRADVNPALIWAHGLELHEVTPAAIAAPEAKAAKAAHDELAAAHLATFGEPIARDKAIAVAARVRAEPAQASILVAQAMADVVDEALVKAEAAPIQPRVKS